MEIKGAAQNVYLKKKMKLNTYMKKTKTQTIKEIIKKWQSYLGLLDWTITTERIDPGQIIYNGETYFIGISTTPENLRGIIYHDVDLYEEAILHELLHVRYPKKNEDWIVNKTDQILID
jgi:hypothetical protein